MRRIGVGIGIGVWLAACTSMATTVQDGAALIGTPAPEWQVEGWSNSPALRLSQLRGRVVLVRWWTGPECQYCAGSMPYLNRWYDAYRDRGLVVIGLYHHKSETPLSADHVAQLAERYGIRFPVAIDPDWHTLKRWWLTGPERPWTSVSFLIDQAGIIRWIHPGGAYSAADAEAIERQIQRLLAQPQAGAHEPSRP